MQWVALLFPLAAGVSWWHIFFMPRSKGLGDSKSEACGNGIDDEIVHAGVSGEQRDLAQFQSQRESDGARIQPAKAPRITKPQEETGRAKGDEMLPIMLDSADRASICRDDGQNYQAKQGNPCCSLEEFFRHCFLAHLSAGGVQPSTAAARIDEQPSDANRANNHATNVKAN